MVAILLVHAFTACRAEPPNRRRPGQTEYVRLPDKLWWEKASAVKAVTLKRAGRTIWGYENGLGQLLVIKGIAGKNTANRKRLIDDLERIKEQGFQSIEVIGPAEGDSAYGGLDTVNMKRIDPDSGTNEDFVEFVSVAQRLGLKVTAFLNVGYFSIRAPDFVAAATDHASKQRDWFLWADAPSSNALPRRGVFSVGEGSPIWQRVKLAGGTGNYFFAVWGTDEWVGSLDGYAADETIGFPQCDWSSDAWRKEAKGIVRFWMETGLDGLSMDAPNEYFFSGGESEIDLRWAQHRSAIADVVKGGHEGNEHFLLAEGTDSLDFLDDKKGNYDAIWDYDLAYYQRGDFEGDVIAAAIGHSDRASWIEHALAGRDARVNAGGILQTVVPPGGSRKERELYIATLVGTGYLIKIAEFDPTVAEASLLKLKWNHPALQQRARRTQLITSDDRSCYAFLAENGKDRVIVVLNFQDHGAREDISVTIPDNMGTTLESLIGPDGDQDIRKTTSFSVELGPLEYAFYAVK